MGTQTIDTYKLTSLEEPSDEFLSQLIRDVAEEASLKITSLLNMDVDYVNEILKNS